MVSTMSIRSLTYYRNKLIPILAGRKEVDAVRAIRYLAKTVEDLQGNRVNRLPSCKARRSGPIALNYYRYWVIPTLEDRHEIDAAIAIRDLADEVDALLGNVVRDEGRYRNALRQARNARTDKG